jgi:hypothetical protein
VLALVAARASAQSRLDGSWRTRASKLTGESSITVNVSATQDKCVGTVVLVNPDRSKIVLPLIGTSMKENRLEFQTDDKGNIIHWRLTVCKNGRRGFLHGSIGEMLIDEKVTKHRK